MTQEGKRKVYAIVRSRNIVTKDYTHTKQIKDENRLVLCSQDKIKIRWERYYKTLLNKKNPRVMFEDQIENLEVTQSISRWEV